MTKIMVFIGILAILALISAGVAEAAGGWSGDVKIATIEVSKVNAEGVWISFKTPPFANSCHSSQYWLQGDPSTVDKMTMIATSALVNSRFVTVYWDGTCITGYSILRGITLK
jgi:hypothetical protein